MIGIRILIVEDNPDLRDDLAEFLTFSGYRVRTARDGIEALEDIDTGSFDIVLSDYQMPRLDGYDLWRMLRARKDTARLPFILCSGGIPPKIEEEPSFRFLRKPITIELLLATIDGLIGRAQAVYYRTAD